MNRGITIGRIFGIRINIDWSWLLIFALITWNLSTLFMETHPGWTLAAQWGLALVAAVLFFLSVLAHELAHSLMARAQGIPVLSITLFLFGGVSNIQREPPSPRAEFLITIVGPLTSIVLGGLLILVGSFALPTLSPEALNNPSGLAAQLSPLATILLWLGPVNLVLGVFNLIPGFPLDGGRLLRSLLWAITDNLRQATRWASWVGQGVAWLLIFAGIAMVFGLELPLFGTGLSGLWLVLIGWFLSTAAVQSYRQVVVQDILEDVPVSQLMRRNPPTVPGSVTIATLVHEHLMHSDEHAFPVVEDGRLLGLVTLEDVRKISRDQWETTLVRDVMTPAAALTTLSPPKDASEALQKLQQRDVRQLPVLENGRLAGLLRRRDILKWLQLQGTE
ncbi:MAG: site-2 protease family protein [Anaerolineaceae bacterium]|nr:site-2 protease family protein [Anaerolineaceae bacterium]